MQEFKDVGVQHSKIFCPGHEIPNDEVYSQYVGHHEAHTGVVGRLHKQGWYGYSHIRVYDSSQNS